MVNLKLVLILVVAGVAVCGPVCAQTIALYVDTPEGYVSAYDVTVGGIEDAFELVTVVDIGDHDMNALEWVQTPLAEPGAPGIFVLIRSEPICGSCHHLGNRQLGEYLFATWHCGNVDPVIEVSRIMYMVFEDVLGDDIVLGLRGFEAGDTRPSSFGGSPGFVDCSENKIPLTVEGGPALITGAGVVVPTGNVVINPTPTVAVGADGSSFGWIKAVFR